MKPLIKFTFVLTTVLLFMAFNIPKGWNKSGSDPDKYEMNIEKGAGQDGKIAATIKSLSDLKPNSSAAMTQTFAAEKYLGKRIRMTAFMKTKDVLGWTGFMLRVDQNGPPGQNQIPAIDNMRDRQIKGSTDWKKHEIVLDVVANASNIIFGASLNGEGQIWFDNFSFEIVDNTVPLTGSGAKNITKAQPENLNFEE